MSDAKQVAASVESVARSFGRLDALVNNAGVAVFAAVMDTSDDDWSRVLAVNLTGPFLGFDMLPFRSCASMAGGRNGRTSP